MRTENRTMNRPNILFILLDDMGKEWVSCYGARDVPVTVKSQVWKKGRRT